MVDNTAIYQYVTQGSNTICCLNPDMIILQTIARIVSLIVCFFNTLKK